MIKQLSFLSILFCAVTSFAASEGGYKTKIDSRAKHVEYDKEAFKSDPKYKEHKYDYDEQLKIYGGKRPNDEPFYFHFLGRRMYPVGQFYEGLDILGRKNRLYPHLIGFGDLRIAYANYNDNIEEQAEIAARLNFDLDMKLTSTERIHAFFRPLDKDGQFTRVLFNDGETDYQERLDVDMDALFFEGDIGWIWAGISGDYAKFDLPFAFGLMPMLFQNGIWLNDIFRGVAFTIPARNSKTFDISNMDTTFFMANDDINSAVSTDQNDVKIFGFNSFIEMLKGYFEIGYAYTEDEIQSDGDQSYHNIGFSFSHRWHDIASLSYRVIHNFGQENVNGVPGEHTADGTLLLLETSWMTSLPYTLLPYFNMFYGIENPQSVARVGGILQNTGILFEGDGLTGFPTLDADGNNTWGASLGVEYLFNLDKQIVVEATAVFDHTGGKQTNGNQYGLGVRYQLPLTSTIIFRADAMYGWQDLAENLFGVRTELRWKF